MVVPTVMSETLDADHQAEREQRVHQRLAPFGLLLAEVPVDMSAACGLSVMLENSMLSIWVDGARIAVLGELAGNEVLEIEPAALVPNGRRFRHLRLPAPFRR